VFVPASVRAVRENPHMVQKTVVLLEDDLDGGTADETVTFALDGVQYEMDLSTAHAAGLREVLAPYVGVGRRIGGRPVPRRRVGGGPARTDREQLAAIRAWARGRGMDVSDRGRIAGHILEAYNTGVSAPPAEEPAAEAPSPLRRPRKSS
jgi:hypothetical protein